MSEIKSRQSYKQKQGLYSDLPQLCDGRIVIDDGFSFDVHKVILAARSPFFRALFCGIDSDKAEHRISNITMNCMSEVLNYIYTNDVCVTEMNINDLLVAADYLVLEDLKLELAKHVKIVLTDDNSLSLCCTAYQINENDILQNCLTYIERRFRKIVEKNEKDLSYLPQELLRNILRRRNLNVESERTVWEVISNWTQADRESRLKDVPSLLTVLALDEIGTDLAADVMNNDIVFKNLHIKPDTVLDTCKKYFDVFNSDDHLLKRLLHKYSNDFPLRNFRIPQKLNIISKDKFPDDPENEFTSEIYISYDETLDFWRKITEIEILLPRYITTIGWNIFLFEFLGHGQLRVLSYNLRTKELKTVEELQRIRISLDDEVVAIGHHIYIFGTHDNKICANVYDATRNIWSRYELLNNNNSFIIQVASIKENIFVVGVNEDNMNEMISLMFNSITRRHVFVAKPNFVRSSFSLVSYREKVYLISGFDCEDKEIQNVEVYDPAQNLWKQLPAIPFPICRRFVNVFNDQLFVYELESEDEENPVAARWNDLEEGWDILEKSKVLECPSEYKLCSIDDDEMIKFLTRQNRQFEVQMEKSPFIFL